MQEAIGKTSQDQHLHKGSRTAGKGGREKMGHLTEAVGTLALVEGCPCCWAHAWMAPISATAANELMTVHVSVPGWLVTKADAKVTLST